MRQLLAVVEYDFRGFRKNPKVILTFLLGFVLCYLLSSRVMTVIETYGTLVQAVEPFLWTFGDGTAILLSSVLVLLLFSDLPRMSPAVPYFLCRTTRKRWLAGQLVYVAAVTALYTGFMLAATVLLCMKNSYIGNIWSETAAALAYSGLGETLNVPSTVKVMENVLPYGCMTQVLVLLFLYMLCLALIVLAGNLILGKGHGMIPGLLFCLYGFLLDPKVLQKLLGLEDYEMYRINVAIGWLSPLSHVTYANHNFGYDRMPAVWQSCMVFLGILLVLIIICMRALKNYNFIFTGVG